MKSIKPKTEIIISISIAIMVLIGIVCASAPKVKAETTGTTQPEISAIPSTEPAVTPTPVIAGNIMPVPTEAPTPEPIAIPTTGPAIVIPDTLKRMAEYDYVSKSVTGLSSKKRSLSTLKYRVKKYGKLYGIGMPYNEYRRAMTYQWTDLTEYDKQPGRVTVDIKKTMDYAAYVGILKKLSRYDGVYLYKIGKSTQGRDLLALEIDIKSNTKKDVYMLTGQVHAREFAGGTFIVKQFADLIQKAQTDKATMDFLKKHKFVAVPIINVDGREVLIKRPGKWMTGAGSLWKSYLNGTDGNRNFPGLKWGQVASGNRKNSQIESKPAYANYPGSYAGSNNETKALMKWLYHYVVVEQAVCYFDLHDQGSIVYAGKGWQTKSQARKSLAVRTKFLNMINQGIKNRKYTRVYEDDDYGLDGEGSTLTDYAVTLAIGAKFSPAYGFFVFTDGKKERILMEIKDLDRKRIKVKPVNKNFSALTVEIGYGSGYLGNSFVTRIKLAKEYKNYHFDKMVISMPRISGR